MSSKALNLKLATIKHIRFELVKPTIHGVVSILCGDVEQRCIELEMLKRRKNCMHEVLMCIK